LSHISNQEIGGDDLPSLYPVMTGVVWVSQRAPEPLTGYQSGSLIITTPRKSENWF
jgi:hypothetical protein